MKKHDCIFRKFPPPSRLKINSKSTSLRPAAGGQIRIPRTKCFSIFPKKTNYKNNHWSHVLKHFALRHAKKRITHTIAKQKRVHLTELHIQENSAVEPIQNLHPTDRRLAAKYASYGPKAVKAINGRIHWEWLHYDKQKRKNHNAMRKMNAFTS